MANIKTLVILLGYKSPQVNWMERTFCYGRNLWEFLDAKGKLKIITFAKSASTEKAFEEW